MIDVFENVLLRISGIEFDTIESLNFNAPRSHLHEIHSLIKQKKDSKLIITALLHNHIATLSDSVAQNLLLNYRRKIHNDKATAVGEVENVVTSEIKILLEQYFELLEKINLLSNQLHALYQSELVSIRKNLRAAIDRPAYKNGMLLSSNALFNESLNYKGSGDRKEAKSELGIISYLSRIVTKTSPFSSFTNIGLAKIKSLPTSPIILSNPKSVHSLILPNNYLLKFLKALFKNFAQIQVHLKLVLNSSVHKQGENLKFYINCNNSESFQTLKSNIVLDEILKLFKKQSTNTTKQIIDTISGNFEIDNCELQAYIKELIALGLLEYQFDFQGTDGEWLKSVLKFLKETEPSPELSEIIRLFKKFSTSLKKFESAKIEDRPMRLTKIHNTYLELFLYIHEKASLSETERDFMKNYKKVSYPKQAQDKETIQERENDFKQEQSDLEVFKHVDSTVFAMSPEKMIYEDSKLPLEALIDTDQATNVITQLQNLLDYFLLLDQNIAPKKILKDFYLSDFSNKEYVDVLDFYEAYFRKKQSNEVADISGHVDFGNITYNKIIREVQSQINPDDEVINITLKDLVSTTQNSSKSAVQSYGIFCQPFINEKNEIAVVHNSLAPGFNKFTGRFLTLFPASIKNQALKWNVRGVKSSLLVENCDSSYFNANIHPALLKYKMNIPGSETRIEKGNSIFPDDIAVKYLSESDEIILWHKKKKKQVFILDLGFQSPAGRSSLFTFLGTFTNTPTNNCIGYLLKICNATRRSQNENSKIKYLPRVILNNVLVLQRKTWILYKEALQDTLDIKDPIEFFIKINLWRIDENIPEEVFVYFERHNGSKRPVGDGYKPQYINFSNPFLVTLFKKKADKCLTTMNIQEMLPSSKELMKIDGKRHVIESLFQWKNV